MSGDLSSQPIQSAQVIGFQPTNFAETGQRTKAQMEALRVELYVLVQAAQPCTVRHFFYVLLSDAVLEKTERDYKRMCEYVGMARRSGRIPGT